MTPFLNIIFFFLLCTFISCQKDSQHFILSLDWTPNTNHTGFYIAKAKHWYKEQGLEVEIIQPSQMSVNQLVARGKADFGVSTGYALIKSVEKGLPLKNIADILQPNTSSFYSLPTKPIKKIDDFQNTTYGGWSHPQVDAILQTIAQSLPKTSQPIEQITSSSSDILLLLEQPEIDFVWGYDGWQGIEAKIRKQEIIRLPLTYIDEQSRYTPADPIIITNNAMLEKKLEVVQKFLEVTQKGFEWSSANPSLAVNIMHTEVPEINLKLLNLSQHYLAPLYAEGVPYWGYQDVDRWNTYSQWLFEKKLINKKMKTSDFLYLFTGKS